MKSKLTGLVFFIAAILPSYAQGLQQYLNLSYNYDGAGGSGFVAYYDTRAAGMGDKVGGCYNCNICHTGSTPSAANTNNYANAFLNAWAALEPGRIQYENPNANAVKAWQNIEAADSDGDGVTNIAEITAGSNPGDASSTPASPNCSAVALVQPSPGGTQPYNPNALNASCSKGTYGASGAGSAGGGMGTIGKFNGKSNGKPDAKNVAKLEQTFAIVMFALFLLPLFTLFGLKFHFRSRILLWK